MHRSCAAVPSSGWDWGELAYIVSVYTLQHSTLLHGHFYLLCTVIIRAILVQILGGGGIRINCTVMHGYDKFGSGPPSSRLRPCDQSRVPKLSVLEKLASH